MVIIDHQTPTATQPTKNGPSIKALHKKIVLVAVLARGFPETFTNARITTVVTAGRRS